MAATRPVSPPIGGTLEGCRCTAQRYPCEACTRVHNPAAFTYGAEGVWWECPCTGCRQRRRRLLGQAGPVTLRRRP